MFHSTAASTAPLFFPIFEEDKTSASRNLFTDLSRVQKRAVKSILKTDTIPNSGILPVYSSHSPVFVLLLGKKEESTSRSLRELGENISAVCQKYKLSQIDITPGSLWKTQKSYHAFLEGVSLGTYKFHDYKGTLKTQSDKKNPTITLEKINVLQAQKNLLEKIENTAIGVSFTKDLINRPPSIANPEYTQQLVEKTFGKLPNTKVSALKEKELAKLGAGGILAVGQASDIESRFVIIEYSGGKKEEAPLAFVGKGVTYDTGGLSLKPGIHMRGMKMDLGGCATVLGGLLASILNKADKNIVVVVPLAENLINERAYKPDDIITMINGKTVEITNTDAEGRLLLGDALYYTIDTFKPKSIVNMATLTGAVFYAVGEDMTAGMGNNQALFDALKTSSDATDEPLWQLPLHGQYEKEMKSKIADLLNATIGFKAGTILAGMFLQHFVDKNTPWCHLDIASVAMNEKKGMASGRNVRLMMDFIEKD